MDAKKIELFALCYVLTHLSAATAAAAAEGNLTRRRRCSERRNSSQSSERSRPMEVALEAASTWDTKCGGGGVDLRQMGRAMHIAKRRKNPSLSLSLPPSPLLPPLPTPSPSLPFNCE